jgi:antitoxin (DNA-binding transcriptional repressor) of toxin-antitoxin stability system
LRCDFFGVSAGNCYGERSFLNIFLVRFHVAKKITALKARQHLGQLLEDVCYQNEQYVIERAGKPMAAVVPVWQLEERAKRRERLFATVDEIRQKNKRVKPQIIEREVAEAVKAVRAQAQRNDA